MKKIIIFLLFIISASFVIAYSSTTQNYLTKGFADTLYCSVSGGCGNTTTAGTDYIKFPIKSLMLDDDYYLYFGTLLDKWIRWDSASNELEINLTTSGDIRMYSADEEANVYWDDGLQVYDNEEGGIDLTGYPACYGNPELAVFGDDPVRPFKKLWFHHDEFEPSEDGICGSIGITAEYVEDTDFDFVIHAEDNTTIQCDFVVQLDVDCASPANAFANRQQFISVGSTSPGLPHEHIEVIMGTYSITPPMNINHMCNWVITRLDTDPRDTCFDFANQIALVRLEKRYKQNTLGAKNNWVK